MSNILGLFAIVSGFGWFINAISAFNGELSIPSQVTACAVTSVFLVGTGVRWMTRGLR
jgi:hypothetical protein